MASSPGRLSGVGTAVDRPSWAELMGLALVEASKARTWGDVPIGAVVVDGNGRVVGAGANERELTGNPLAHAEILALTRAADALGSWRLDDTTLVCTLEPCTMCAGAITQTRVGRLVFGAFDAKAGAVASLFDVVRDPRLPHRPTVISGIRDAECAKLLRTFFAEHR